MLLVEGLRARYGRIEVLHGIDLAVNSGEIVTVIGANGAGKTTLLRLLFMSLQPTRGLIRSFGRDITKIPRSELPMLRRRVGIVFQDFQLLDHLTTYENVALPLRVRGKEEASYRNDVLELLKWVGLGERINVLPPVLSGGEKQRVAIARALIDRPEILLADEPTGALDSRTGAEILNLFHRLRDEGHTVVLITHDPQVAAHADRMLEIHDGVLKEAA